jgi:hypothetical protein
MPALLFECFLSADLEAWYCIGWFIFQEYRGCVADCFTMAIFRPQSLPSSRLTRRNTSQLIYLTTCEECKQRQTAPCPPPNSTRINLNQRHPATKERIKNWGGGAAHSAHCNTFDMNSLPLPLSKRIFRAPKSHSATSTLGLKGCPCATSSLGIPRFSLQRFIGGSGPPRSGDRRFRSGILPMLPHRRLTRPSFPKNRWVNA